MMYVEVCPVFTCAIIAKEAPLISVSAEALSHMSLLKAAVTPVWTSALVHKCLCKPNFART